MSTDDSPGQPKDQPAGLIKDETEGQNGDPPASRHRVDWLRLGGAPLIHTPGRVGMSALPQRPDSDMAALKRLGIGTVVSLVDEEEMRVYGVSDLGKAVRDAGLLHLGYPIVNGLPPVDILATRSLCRRLLGLLGEGEHILLHCIGGLGRTGTIASALLIHEGHSAPSAIALVRRIRHPYCVETLAQESFLQGYAKTQQRVSRCFYFVPKVVLSQVGLQGEQGARTYPLTGHELLGPVLTAQLPRALTLLHRRLIDEEVIILSGELPLEALLPVPPGSVEVDRAYRFDGTGLLPIRLHEIR